VDTSKFSRFLSILRKESLTVDAYLLGFSYEYYYYWEYNRNISVSHLVDSPALQGMLLIPSDQAIADFEARWGSLFVMQDVPAAFLLITFGGLPI
jgi:hypothetical protein